MLQALSVPQNIKFGRDYLVRHRSNLRHYAACCVHCWWICQACRLALLTVLRGTVCRGRSFWNTVQAHRNSSQHLGNIPFSTTGNLCTIRGTIHTVTIIHNWQHTISHSCCHFCDRLFFIWSQFKASWQWHETLFTAIILNSVHCPSSLKPCFRNWFYFCLQANNTQKLCWASRKKKKNFHTKTETELTSEM